MVQLTLSRFKLYRVNAWTEYLREGLVKLSETITRRRRVSEVIINTLQNAQYFHCKLLQSFAETEVVKEDGAEMLQEIAKDIRKMMQEKVNAIKVRHVYVKHFFFRDTTVSILI